MMPIVRSVNCLADYSSHYSCCGRSYCSGVSSITPILGALCLLWHDVLYLFCCCLNFCCKWRYVSLLFSFLCFDFSKMFLLSKTQTCSFELFNVYSEAISHVNVAFKKLCARINYPYFLYCTVQGAPRG